VTRTAAISTALLALLALSGAALSAASAGDASPKRKAGYWQTTVVMPDMGGGAITGQFCTDAATEAKTSALAGNPGDSCDAPKVARTAKGFDFSIRCRGGPGAATTHGSASGDFQSSYRLDAVTVLDKPPIPSMTKIRTVVTAKYLGPCPAGRKPGDVVMGGKVRNIFQK
jgi:hypothetical protein